jgi:primosomal protein N' (replication factor Y)
MDTSDSLPTGSRVVRVLCDVPALRKPFDYLAPPELAARLAVGSEVRVVLHGRRVGGWVVEIDVEPPPGLSLHPLSAVRGWGPPPAIVELAQWAAWRWAGPPTAFLRTASPSTAVRDLRPVTAPGSAPGAAPGSAPRSGPGAPAGDGGVGSEVLADAFGGGVAVVRLAPGAGQAGLAAAAAARLDGAAPGSGVLVLVPAQRDAATVAAWLRRAGAPVALLPGEWAAARSGGVVAVGTRAAAFAPLSSLAAAVVLDAHDEVYQEERSPTWSAWQVVAERCRRDQAPCVLVSPCPTLDLLAAGRLVTTSRRVERGGWPALEVVDRRGDDPRTGLFSERLVALLHWGVDDPTRRVVCVLNRTGRVRLLACAACHELARCERCQGALELVALEGDEPSTALRCRRCGLERPVVCARCGATRMKALRLGVTRVREEIEAIVRVPVAEISGPAGAMHRDRGTGGTAGDDDGEARVIVGTEAALHRVTSADAVAFLDFDAELLAPRIRAGEQALALLARASRLVAGPAHGGASSERSPGRVLVQTRLPHHEVLQAAVGADPGRLAASETEVRRALALPPFGALATLSGPAAEDYARALAPAAPAGVEVRPLGDGTWALRGPRADVLCDLLAAVARPAGRVRVAVDPLRA